jgi:putative intracellular protease/amidase
MSRRILIALTSHDRLGDTGRSTGAYLPEVAHPWRAFTEARHTVDLMSVAGGRPPLDGVDSDDPVQQAFLADPVMSEKFEHTLTPAQVDVSAYDAIFFAGGHGTMWDFPGNTKVADIARAVYERGGVIAAVCHGPAALVGLTLSDGSALVADKEVAAFTNEEETAVRLTDVVPFLLQSRLEELGAKHVAAAPFQPCVVTDGRLVTGQNPASATGVAEAVIEVLAET